MALMTSELYKGKSGSSYDGCNTMEVVVVVLFEEDLASQNG